MHIYVYQQTYHSKPSMTLLWSVSPPELLHQGVAESPILLLNTLSSPGCNSTDPISCILELTGIHQALIQLQRI